MEDRHQDDETMDNLDFEEISDEELDPEEAKTGKPGPEIRPLPPLSSSGIVSSFVMHQYPKFKYRSFS
jgi:hypothetical protein